MCGCTMTARIAARHRDLLDARVIDADREHQAAEERGRDVVHVQRAARHRLALHGELAAARAACSGSAAAHSPPPPRPPPRPPSRPGPSRAECPCRSRPRSRSPAAAPPACAMQRAAGGVVARPRAAGPGTTPRIARIAHARLGACARTVTRSPSAPTAKPRMSKPMATLPTEAGAKAVAPLARGARHRRAPRYAASRSRSANTPPAVTSGPAPGPCTISGLSQ